MAPPSGKMSVLQETPELCFVFCHGFGLFPKDDQLFMRLFSESFIKMCPVIHILLTEKRTQPKTLYCPVTSSTVHH